MIEQKAIHVYHKCYCHHHVTTYLEQNILELVSIAVKLSLHQYWYINICEQYSLKRKCSTENLTKLLNDKVIIRDPKAPNSCHKYS